MALHPDIAFTYSFASAYSFQAGRSAILRLAENGLAEAYFGADAVLSVGILSGLQDLGKNVPNDVGLIGFNNMEMAGWENIALTTIHQPIAQIIASSVELMVAMLENPDRYPEARLFPCHVVERKTLRPIQSR